MSPFRSPSFAPPKLARGAYLHDGERLYFVVRIIGSRVVLENCATDRLAGCTVEEALAMTLVTPTQGDP